MDGPRCLLAQDGAMSLQNSTEDIVQKLVNWFNYSTSLGQEKMHQATHTN